MKRDFDRYEVMKSKDIENALSPSEQIVLSALLSKLSKYRFDNGKPELECVVVESDWPEYERVWEMIETRVDNEELTKFLESLVDDHMLYNKPYFYVINNRLICSDAHSETRLTRYSGYDCVTLYPLHPDACVTVYDSSVFFGTKNSPCHRVLREDILAHKDNLQGLIDSVIAVHSL